MRLYFNFELQADHPDINPDGIEKAEEAAKEAIDDDIYVSTTKQRNDTGQEAGE